MYPVQQNFLRTAIGQCRKIAVFAVPLTAALLLTFGDQKASEGYLTTRDLNMPENTDARARGIFKARCERAKFVRIARWKAQTRES